MRRRGGDREGGGGKLWKIKTMYEREIESNSLGCIMQRASERACGDDDGVVSGRVSVAAAANLAIVRSGVINR